MTFTTRFAPSPTGPLHLGHAYSALLAHDMARAENGTFLLRIEDIDQSRARAAWETQIYDDLKWLGISWDAAPVRQSDQMIRYSTALETLYDRDLIYPCSCNRRDIQSALSAPQEGAVLPTGPDGLIYPGTCAPKRFANHTTPRDPAAVYRFATADAAYRFGTPCNDDMCLSFTETGHGPNDQTGTISVSSRAIPQTIGDIVIARRDMGTSYHLSVVLDDADQDITHVIRGADLFDATAIHVILQKSLGLPTPIYHHHALVRDDSGKRLAKRDDARAISKYRAEGATLDDIRHLVGL
jgi:glutamyl-Q tRNA(Asp) synthetase